MKTILSALGLLCLFAGHSSGQTCQTVHAPASAAPLKQPWTIGPKKVLFMIVEFSDDPGPVITKAAAEQRMNGPVNDFFTSASYGLTSIHCVATRPLLLPKTKAQYTLIGSNPLLADARTAAAAAGHRLDDYDLDIVAFKTVWGGWIGRAILKGKGLWLNGRTNASLINHELGHNYGLEHAGNSIARDDSVNGPVIAGNEYGHLFDHMGWPQDTGDPRRAHFQAEAKRALGWLPASSMLTVTGSGTYRIAALDRPGLLSSPRSLQIPLDGTASMFVELRQSYPQNPHMAGGVLVYQGTLDPRTTSSDLLDANPDSIQRVKNSGLAVGRTLSDYANRVHVTPIGIQATLPPTVDVVVQRGSFPANRAPSILIRASALRVNPSDPVTFTATVSDPDMDPLAVSWELGDGQLGTNALQVSHSYSDPGDHLVSCTVTDMKGGRATAKLVLTVGARSQLHIAGRITEHDTGRPLEGARVVLEQNYYTKAETHTDSDGRYRFVEMLPGVYQVKAIKWRHMIAPPRDVDLRADRENVDFHSVVTSYGEAVPGARGLLPQLSSFSLPTLGNREFQLAVSEIVPLDVVRPGVLVIGSAPASLPFAGGTVRVRPEVILYFTIGRFYSQASVNLPISNDPRLHGLPVYVQALIKDDQAPGGWSMTKALKIVPISP
jgi:hypothetical protein